MKLELVFALPTNGYYGELAQDYYARLREFFKFGKAKAATKLVFVVGKSKQARQWTSQELAEFLKKQMLSGTKGLVLSVVDASVCREPHSDPEREEFWVELINFVPSPKGADLLAVLALEQLYRACMIYAGRTYHK